MGKDLPRSCPKCNGLQRRNEVGEIHEVRELLIGLTHEIGNSLQAISGELDLLTLTRPFPQQSSKAVYHGIEQIRKLTREISEYLSPPPLKLRSEDLGLVLTEVIRASEPELVEYGIQTTVVLGKPLPK